MRVLCKRLGLLVAIPVLALSLTEITLSLSGFGHPSSFLIEDTINGEVFYRENPDFGLLFFPPELNRSPQPIRTPKKRGPDILRVCVLGGSAAMGDPEPAYGLPRMLDDMLRETMVDRDVPARSGAAEDAGAHRDVEVINMAMTAINSHVVRVIARDLEKLEPDHVVIYMGNNEVLGPFGPGSVLRGFTPSSKYIKWNVFARSMRLGQLIDRITRREAPASHGWKGLALFSARKISRDDPRMEAVYTHFARNLEEIIDAARDAGARVTLSTVAANLKWPPFVPGSDAFDAALKDEREGRHAPALAGYRQAVEGDLLRFRADKTINETIREYAGSADSFVDADRAISGQSWTVTTSNLFYDHVHLNFLGTYNLAALIARAIADDPNANIPDDEFCRKRLACTVRDQLEVSRRVYERLSHPPFIDQPHAPNLRAARAERINSLAMQARMSGDDRWKKEYAEALGVRPDDWLLRMRYVERLVEAGDFTGALAGIDRVLEQVPDLQKASLYKGRVLVALGKISEARALFLGASRGGESVRVDLLMEYGAELALRGFSEEAEQVFLDILVRAPGHAFAWYNLGRIIAARKDPKMAEVCYRKALTHDPKLAEALNNIGSLHAEQGRTADAIAAYSKALAVRPDYLSARKNLAKMLIVEKRYEEAANAYRLVLEQNPNDRETLHNLEKLREYLPALGER